jgi:hypothetical protein
MSRPTYKQLYTQGIESEKKLLPIFNTYFEDTFVPTDRYHPMDFISDKSNIELKTRNCNYARYDTTLLPSSKLRYALQSKKDTYFAFAFTDGLFYIKYDPTLFTTFQTDLFQPPDLADFKEHQSFHTFIPINLLKKLSLE